ncbi:MAG: DUF2795 domain-containing protein [Methanoculleus sp.]|nr:DUF2795 domain-containing protein [Methanoculleus sp.]
MNKAEQQAGSVLETRQEETVNLMRAHDIRDVKVRNPQGENLGDISDVAIDRESGRIAYAVLSYGGVLGFGEKHFAIPWEAVRTRPGERSATLDADKKTLDNAPGFSRDRMPLEADWSLVRTPPPARAATAMAAAAAPVAPVTEREVPPSRAAETAAPVETTSPAGERVVPTPPPVQTVAAGWGGQPATQRVEERPVMTEGPPPTGTGVREVHRERIPETPPRETVEEVHREPAAMMETERPTTTTGPAPGHLSAADLQVYLKGIDYPVGRQDLVTHARKNNAPQEVISSIEGFSDRTYRSAADVSTEFGREVRGERSAAMEARREPGISAEEVRREEMGQPATPAVEAPTAQRTAPSHTRLSAADLQVYLKGIDYPVARQDLVTHARKNNAPEDVIAAIENFSDRTYRSAADVSTEFGKVR